MFSVSPLIIQETATSVATSPSPAKPRRAARPVNLAPARRWVQDVLVALLLMGIALAIASPPRLDLLFAASPVIQIHVYAAAAALILGAAILVLRKGKTFHRVAGWVWVALMATLAVVSLFITEITPGRWSMIHILSGWTLVLLPLGVILARRHKARSHSRVMMGTYLGGLIVAGAFTFVPGRLMWMVFFGH